MKRRSYERDTSDVPVDFPNAGYATSDCLDDPSSGNRLEHECPAEGSLHSWQTEAVWDLKLAALPLHWWHDNGVLENTL